MWIEFWDMLYSPVWPQTCGDPHASASAVQRLPVCATTSQSKQIFLFQFYTSELFPFAPPSSYISSPRMGSSLSLAFQVTLWMPDRTPSPTQTRNNFWTNSAWPKPQNQYGLGLSLDSTTESDEVSQSQTKRESLTCLPNNSVWSSDSQAAAEPGSFSCSDRCLLQHLWPGCVWKPEVCEA